MNLLHVGGRRFLVRSAIRQGACWTTTPPKHPAKHPNEGLQIRWNHDGHSKKDGALPWSCFWMVAATTTTVALGKEATTTEHRRRVEGNWSGSLVTVSNSRSSTLCEDSDSGEPNNDKNNDNDCIGTMSFSPCCQESLGCWKEHAQKLSVYQSEWNRSEQQQQRDADAARAASSSSLSVLPTPDCISRLRLDLKFCRRSPNFRSDDDYCDELRYQVALSDMTHSTCRRAQAAAVAELREMARNGQHGASMYLYGRHLAKQQHEGDAPPESKTAHLEAAMVWWKWAFDLHGHVRAGFALAMAHYSVGKRKEALRLWKQLALHHQHAQAAHYLALHYLQDESTFCQGLEWWILAAQRGYSPAQKGLKELLSSSSSPPPPPSSSLSSLSSSFLSSFGEADTDCNSTTAL